MHTRLAFVQSLYPRPTAFALDLSPSSTRHGPRRTYYILGTDEDARRLVPNFSDIWMPCGLLGLYHR